jgi:MarR family transcriptional regulator, organic hydroperoxide resistance regulator
MAQNHQASYRGVVSDGFFDRDPDCMPLSKLVAVTGAAVGRHFHRVLAEHGLTPTAMGVLGVLGGTDRLSHRELAGHLGITPGALTPVVDALEAAGEIVRDRDPDDRRVVRLSVTPAGRQHLHAAFGLVALALRERFPHPAPEHARIVRDYLTALLVAVGEEER